MDKNDTPKVEQITFGVYLCDSNTNVYVIISRIKIAKVAVFLRVLCGKK